MQPHQDRKEGEGPSPWLFKQRAQSGLLEKDLAFIATLLSGSKEQGPTPRKKKRTHIREHPSVSILVSTHPQSTLAAGLGPSARPH
jgi:hypothetical protein